MPRQPLHALLASVLALAENRLELMSLELREEHGRLVGWLALGMLAACCLVLALASCAVAFILYLEPPNRVAGCLVVAALAGAGGGAAWWLLRRQLRLRPPAFELTRHEFRKDLNCL